MKEGLAQTELAQNQIRLLTAIRDQVDGGKGYFLCMQAMPVLLEAEPTVAAQQLRTLLDLGYIYTPHNYASVDITTRGRDLLKPTQAKLNRIWNRSLEFLVINTMLRFYRE